MCSNLKKAKVIGRKLDGFGSSRSLGICYLQQGLEIMPVPKKKGKSSQVIQPVNHEAGICTQAYSSQDFPGGSLVKDPSANAGDPRVPCIGGGNGNLLQYSCLEDPRDGGA